MAEQRQSPETAVGASVMIATRHRGTGRVEVVLHVRTSRCEVVLPRETRRCHVSMHVTIVGVLIKLHWRCKLAYLVLVHRYLEIASVCNEGK